MRRPSRRAQRGITLLELLIAVAVMAFISMLIYGAFAGMKNSKEGLARVNDRYREARIAMDRINRDLQGAYISSHLPINPSLAVEKTGFKGTTGSPADRIDFNSFTNRRLDRDSKESDQAEVSYFGSADPKNDGVTDLARRTSSRLDIDFERGGRVDVLATDIDLFDVEYLDPLTGQWVERWDSTQATGQPDRLPVMVHVLLVLNGGNRDSRGGGQKTIRVEAKIPIRIQRALTFATQ